MTLFFFMNKRVELCQGQAAFSPEAKRGNFMEKGKTLKKCIRTITMHHVVQQLFNC